jgi:hypothetical protein
VDPCTKKRKTDQVLHTKCETKSVYSSTGFPLKFRGPGGLVGGANCPLFHLPTRNIGLLQVAVPRSTPSLRCESWKARGTSPYSRSGG